MNCEKSRELFAEYLGEEISKTNARGLKEHLKSCSGCQQELALLVRTRSALRVGWPEEPIPQNLNFEFSTPAGKNFWSRLFPSRLPGVAWASISVTACFLICLATLALLQAQVRIENGSFSLSFGRVARAIAGPMTINGTQPDVEAVKILLDQSLKQVELNQSARLQQALQETKLEWESKRDADFARIAKELQYLESAQNVVWKETLTNNSNMETLARAYVQAGYRPPQQ
jgi:hypothetical protein